MKLLKIIGLGLAATALASWIVISPVLAKREYKKATGKDCAVCHGSVKPYEKDMLTAKGKTFRDCLNSGKTAAACKYRVD